LGLDRSPPLPFTATDSPNMVNAGKARSPYSPEVAGFHTFNFSLIGLINTAFARAYAPQPGRNRPNSHIPFIFG
jgi:hypothetical protein